MFQQERLKLCSPFWGAGMCYTFPKYQQYLDQDEHKLKTDLNTRLEFYLKSMLIHC